MTAGWTPLTGTAPQSPPRNLSCASKFSGETETPAQLLRSQEIVRNRFTKSVCRDYPAPMRQNFATIRDVANYAGVSVTTVSRYLNGSMVLPPDIAARIERACRHLSYRPNQLAKRLSLGRSELVGLITPEIANPFFAALATAPPRDPNEIECAGTVADPAVAEYGGVLIEDFRRCCSTVSV
jgi:hypothetical protein